MKTIKFTDKSWESVQKLANETGLDPIKVLERSLAVYATLLEMYNQKGPHANVEVHGWKWKLIKDSTYVEHNNLKSLLGLDQKSPERGL